MKFIIPLLTALLLIGCDSRKKLVETSGDSNDTANMTELGELRRLTYKGTLPVISSACDEYLLTIEANEHSGDGTFQLMQTCGEEDSRELFSGKRFTQRGIPGDDNATVWQCIDESKGLIFNFLKNGDSILTPLDSKFEKIHDCELKLILAQ